MELPPFNAEGDLPPGVYPVTLAEALARFGAGTAQRQIVAARLQRVYQLVSSTGRLARFVVFGSFVTAKPEPRDVDVILVMADGFDLASVSAEVAVVFNHSEADAQLGASVFWLCRGSALGGEQAMVEYWQTRRGGGQRGIIEIVEGGT
jgi:hypothetical protein